VLIDAFVAGQPGGTGHSIALDLLDKLGIRRVTRRVQCQLTALAQRPEIFSDLKDRGAPSLSPVEVKALVRRAREG